MWPNKRLVIAAIAMMGTPAMAQQQAPTEYNLKVAPADVDLIGRALAKLSYEDVAPLIQKLREQVVAQQQVAAPKVEGK